METKRRRHHAGTMAAGLILMILASCGCSDQRDQRLADMASQNLAEQARQNDRLAEQSRQIAAASKELVKSDAEARRQMLDANASLQREIQTSRGNIERQRDELERERRIIAQERNREPVVAEAIKMLALILACLLPLALAAYVLYAAKHSQDYNLESVEMLLVRELVPVPRLSLPPPATRIRSSASQSQSA